MSRRRALGQKRQPFKDEQDALELLARMLVGGGYREPVAGTGTQGCARNSRCNCALCVAGAAGFMRDPLAREVALVVALRADKVAVSRVSGRAYNRLCRAIRGMHKPVLKLRKPSDRWRMRVIVYDAMNELVHPENRRPYRELAKDTKMRAADYTRIHKVVTAELQQLMNEARSEFELRLWGKKPA